MDDHDEQPYGEFFGEMASNALKSPDPEVRASAPMWFVAGALRDIATAVSWAVEMEKLELADRAERAKTAAGPSPINPDDCGTDETQDFLDSGQKSAFTVHEGGKNKDDSKRDDDPEELIPF